MVREAVERVPWQREAKEWLLLAAKCGAPPEGECARHKTPFRFQAGHPSRGQRLPNGSATLWRTERDS